MDVHALNYHHLRYFWAVAREGGVGRAALKLRVSQPSLSAQIRLLEGVLEQKLFAREGRRLALTEAGRLVFGYAEQIFGLGGEMLDALHDRPTAQSLRMSVGIANVVPKRMAYLLLAPVMARGVRLECLEGPPEALLADLALHRLDAVLSDAPAPPSVRVQAFSHPLGESRLAWVGTAEVASRHRRRFPRSLDGAPVLLPTVNTARRRGLDAWFEREGLRPRIVAEFEDSALLEAFAATGAGLCPVPAAIAKDLRLRVGLEHAGRVPDLRERFYAITVQRRLRHDGVAALVAQAGRTLSRGKNR